MPGKTRTITFLVLATISGMSLWFMTAAILPDMAAEAGIGAERQALLSSAVQAGFVAGALVIALSGIADRLDPRRVFALCAVGTALTNAALLAVPVGGAGAVALRFATGALMAGVYPVGMKLAIGWGLRDRGFLVGLLVGALTLGNSLPYLLAWLGGANWRLALVAGSAVALLGGVLVFFTQLGPHHARAAAFHPRAVMLAWTDRRIRAAFLGYLGHMWELFALWAWVGAAAAASYAFTMGADEAVSLGKLTAFLTIAAGAPVCVLAGKLADRIGKARVASVALVGSATAAVMSAAAFGGPVWLTLGLFVVWGIAVIPDSAQFSALVADYAPPEYAGSLLTLQTALGFMLTIATVHFTPIIADAWGWPVLLAGLSVGPALGLVAMVPLVRGKSGDRSR